MNKKLKRLLRPSAAIYFVALFLFGFAALVLEHYRLGAAELALTLALLGLRFMNRRERHQAITDYARTADEMMQKMGKGEVPFPVAMICLSDNELVWCNRAFTGLTQADTEKKHIYLTDLFPDFSTEWLTAGKTEAPRDLTYNGLRFRVTGSVLRDGDVKSGLVMGMLYFQDQTELIKIRDEYIRTKPMLGIVLVDNYDELTNNLPDAVISNLNAELNTKINAWTDKFGGLLRKLERNRYLILLEAKDLALMTEEKFSLLESIRTVLNPAGTPATVSIGLGKDGADFKENYNYAALSIEMSLSRGGDQVVVKDRYDFTFYGGRIKQSERRTKVKSRVMASTLSELIAQSGHVFIMGHKMADLDALGSAVGLCCLCRKKGKKVSIVIDREINASKALLEILYKQPEYEGCFITGQDALLVADAKSLLIVVDTNRPDQVECKPLLESLRRVVVIDHHRRAADYIEQPVLNVHEPFASSASELVTELLQYAVEPSDIKSHEAAALLAGIVLDTKNFGVRTTSRTFEAAAFLRRIGADTVAVKRLFQNDLSATVARYKIVQQAQMYRNTIAIAALDYTATRTIAAQAADELLNISGIDTSFVLYPQDDQTIISARSIGDANVQVILEPLGGGGNAATAGAQVKNQTVPVTLEKLYQSIDNFYNQ